MNLGFLLLGYEIILFCQERGRTLCYGKRYSLVQTREYSVNNFFLLWIGADTLTVLWAVCFLDILVDNCLFAVILIHLKGLITGSQLKLQEIIFSHSSLQSHILCSILAIVYFLKALALVLFGLPHALLILLLESNHSC